MDALTLLTLALLSLCGSNDFRTREAAFAKLSRFGEFCPGALAAGWQSQDQEISRRAKLLLDRWYVKHADELSRQLKPPPGMVALPWIVRRCQSEWDGGIHWTWDYDSPYLKAAIAAGFEDKPPLWPSWSEATRLWMRDRIAARLPTAELLEQMAPHSRQWLEQKKDQP